MIKADILDLNGGAKTALLLKIVHKLDKLDEEDFFGAEGWKKFLLGEE